MENFNSIAEIDVADFVSNFDIDYANAPRVSILDLDLDIDYANAPHVSILDLDLDLDINKL